MEVVELCGWCRRTHAIGPEHCLTGVVLVCGGRDYTNRQRAFAVLDKLALRVEILAVRHGAARGADALADEWARSRGYVVQPYPADWDRHGKAAGPIRNREMLAACDPAVPSLRVVCVVAFPGGSGTADMIRQSKAAGLPVWAVPNPRTR